MIRSADLTKRFIGLMFIGVAVVSVGMLAWWMFLSDDMREYRRFQKTYISHAHAVTDLSDDRKLVGFSHNVFVGRVVEKLGQTEEYGFPETQFRVEVLETLKGSLSGEVTVNQQGGVRTWDGSAYRREGDPNLLEPGKTYLFATRHLPEKDWHTLMPGYGNLGIQVSEDASDKEILAAKHTVQLRERFTDAVKNEIPYDPQKPQ